MSEWRHLEGIRYNGKYVTLVEAPWQSKTIFTFPARSLCSLLMLKRMRWMAMGPSSSPLYMLATNNASKNIPMMRPQPLEHSRIKAAKHRLGNSSLMFDPSVTATKEPSKIDS